MLHPKNDSRRVQLAQKGPGKEGSVKLNLRKVGSEYTNSSKGAKPGGASSTL